MKGSLTQSLLVLGHSTSQNLGFAHKPDVDVSYGEETITESNLLELRRRHPSIIDLKTFSKHKEAKNGADWEWHVIGRARTLRMRVQAKRLQKDDKLIVKREAGSSGKQQIDLLIDNAKRDGRLPVYCLYSSERQRSFWSKRPAGAGLEEFETGCLLANAHTVKTKMPKSLADIEKHCVPWHFLAERHVYSRNIIDDTFEGGLSARFLVGALSLIVDSGRDPDIGERTRTQFPTLDELNSAKPLEREIDGVVETGEQDVFSHISAGEYAERGVSRLITLDVREFPEIDEDEEPNPVDPRPSGDER